MIYIKFLKSQLTGNIYPQQVNTRPFTADDLADKLRERYGSIAPSVIDDAFRIISDRLAQGYIVSLDTWHVLTASWYRQARGEGF